MLTASTIVLDGATLTPEGVDAVARRSRCRRRRVRATNTRPENALIHEGSALATGNFYAAELGAALDAVRAAHAHSASLIAGRVSAILDPRMSGLSRFLAADPGHADGGAERVAAGLVVAVRALSIAGRMPAGAACRGCFTPPPEA